NHCRAGPRGLKPPSHRPCPRPKGEGARAVLKRHLSCRSGAFTGHQHQLRHLRPAVVPDRMLAAQAPGNMQDRWRYIKNPAIVPATIPARNECRAEERKADLAAVVMAREHQVNPVSPCPLNVVRRVAKA